MDKGSYKLTDLEKTYGGFLGPAIEVKLDGLKLDSNSIPISSLEVEMTADGGAGNCTITIDSLYDYTTGSWANSVYRKLKVGAELVVKGGYVVKKPLFYGYVDEFSMDYRGGGGPQLVVRAVDGLGYLMSCRDDYYAGQKSTTAAIKEILGKSVTAGFAKSVTIGSGVKDFLTPLLKDEGMDDFTFLRVLAERYGMVLMCLNGEMIFDKLWEKSAALIELEMGRGLLSFQKRYTLYDQVGKVVIWGLDKNNKPIVGTADSVTTGGKGKSAAQHVSHLKNSILKEGTEFALTTEECSDLAQARLNGIAMGFLHGRGNCIGIPELIPGRFIKIKSMVEKTTDELFVSRVVHRFSQGGYFCEFEVKGAKA